MPNPFAYLKRLAKLTELIKAIASHAPDIFGIFNMFTKSDNRQSGGPVYVNSVYLEKTKLTLVINPGDVEVLRTSILPVNANNRLLTWATSNEAVATVSGGVITGVAPGKATIIVTAQDGGGALAACVVRVRSRWQRMTKFIRPSLWK